MFATSTAAPNVAVNVEAIQALVIDGLGAGYGVFAVLGGGSQRAISGSYTTLAEAQTALTSLVDSLGKKAI